MSRAGTFEAHCDEIALRCALFTTRRLARAVTRHFDARLEPSGLRGTQYNVLVAIARAREAGLTELGARLGLDRTALTHALRPLQRAGLVRQKAGGDRRRREFVLTAAGRRRVAAAVPLWRAAQRATERGMVAGEAGGEGRGVDLDWSELGPLLRQFSRQLERAFEPHDTETRSRGR